MSTLYTDNIRANNASQITVPTGQKIVGTDSGSIVAPGGVLQVLQTVDSGTTSYSTTETWTDAGSLSVTITPKFASSKIMIEYFIHNSTNDATVTHRITRNGTAVGIGDANGIRQRVTTRTGRYRSGDENHISPPTGMKYLDSPATTSAITYKVQLRLQVSESPIIMNTSYNQPNNDYTYSGRTISTITVMEIAQ